MSTLNSIYLSRLSNDEAYAFHKAVSELAGAVKSAPFKPYAKKYAEAFDALKTAIDKTAGNSAAATAKEADDARDKAWSGCNFYIKAVADYCPDAKLKAAAKPIASLFEKYGNPTNLSYAKETSVIDNLIESVEALGKTKIKAATFTDWLADLKAKQTAYEAAAKGKVAKAAAKVVGAVKDARNAADSAYSELSKMVSALCLVVGEEAFADFIKKANVIIDKQKTSIKSRKTSAKNSAAKKSAQKALQEE